MSLGDPIMLAMAKFLVCRMSGESSLARMVWFVATVLLLVAGASIDQAKAVPSFARQTGQPCAACHTAFPELTPFGRRFKLNGYTLGGGDSNLPAFAVMALGSLNHTQASQPSGPFPGTGPNDNFLLDQASLFYAGQIYGNLGAFVQVTYAGDSKTVSWDNADFRYADQAKIGGNTVTYGLTVHNNPTVQDVWNTAPAWSFPYVASIVAPAPDAATMLEGNFSGRVAGIGGYTFTNDVFYAELTGYQMLSPSVLKDLGVDPTGLDTIRGVAPYWRLAVEPNWGDHSLEVGTFGMMASIYPGDFRGAGTNRLTDIGLDAQYQYNGDLHAVSLRVVNIYEYQHLASTYLQGASSHLNDHLDSFKGSITYTYDRTWSLTGGYFNLSGSKDFNLYNINGTSGGFSNVSSPNSDGFTAEIAYLPFSNGGPAFWPWANGRIALQYTAYNRFDGAKTNYDGSGRNARDNNTIYLYAWGVF
jgi:hypothetical protein